MKYAAPVAIVIALAFAVAIGVGCGCAFFAETDSPALFGDGRWPEPVPERWPLRPGVTTYEAFGFNREIWQAQGGQEGGLPGLFTIRRIQAGFPLKCLERVHWDERYVDRDKGINYWTDADHPKQSWLQRGIGVDRQGKRVFIPTSPRWLGLLGNMAFYATPIGLLFLVRRMIVHARRRRAASCLHCGYARIPPGELCPECGRTNPIE